MGAYFFMKKTLSLALLASLLIPSLAYGSVLGIATSKDIRRLKSDIDLIKFRIEDLKNQLAFLQEGGNGESLLLGADATNPIAGTNYFLAGSGVSGSATSITLTSLTIPQTGHLILDAELSDTFYITFEPGSRTRQEVVSCTTVVQNVAGTATLSGCSRGLLPFTPFTASTTYQFPHGGGTAVVFSNPPQLYSEFIAKGNSAYITGIQTYASSSLPRAFSTPTYGAGTELYFATKAYVDSVATSGAPNASVSQKGIVQIGTATNTISGTGTGSTGALLVPPVALFNVTSTATTTVPVTSASGTLSTAFINQAANATYSFLGGVTQASSTVTGSLNVTGSSTLAFTTFTGTVSGLSTNNLLAASTTQLALSNSATTTVFSVSIPANTLSASNGIRIEVPLYLQGASGATSTIRAIFGTSTIVSSTAVTGNNIGGYGIASVDIFAQNSTSSQKGVGYFLFSPLGSATGSGDIQLGTASINAGIAQTLSFTVQVAGAFNAGQAYGYKVTKLQF